MGIATGFWALVVATAMAPVTTPTAALSGTATAVPAIGLSESQQHYRIDAANLDSVVAQIQGREPRAGDDGTSVARTRASLAVAYRLVPADTGCRLADLSVSLDVTVRLPHWEAPADMRPQMREQWERMKTGMEIHEQGHRDIAVEAAEYLNTRLHTMAPVTGTDCDALERRIVRERIKAQMRHQNLDFAYDKRTRHGVGQAPEAAVADSQDHRGPRDFRDRGQGRDLSEKAGY
jgi:predicted secreted Zn-dependent protease